MKKILLLLLAIAPILAAGQTSTKQTIKTISSTKRYWEYLPPGYATETTKKFTVVIFLHGLGQKGDTEAEMQKILDLPDTPPNQAETNDFPFILLSPQLPTTQGGWYKTYVEAMVKEAKKYRCDTTNIYLVGVSLGGGGVWQHGTDLTLGKQFRGLVPVCGSESYPSQACNVVTNKNRVWAFHGTLDGTVPVSKTVNMINAINACSPAPNPAPKLTLYEGDDHFIWDKAFSLTNNLHLPNVYQWIMETHSGTPIANAGTDRTITLPVNSLALTGSGTDNDGTIASYQWTKVSGGSVTLQGTTTPTLNLSNLTVGEYVFLLQVTDNSGWPSTPDEIKVTVLPSANQVPVVNAGADKLITVPASTVTVTGSATDADGTIASYTWTKVSGGSATFSNANAASTDITNLAAGTYVFRLTATDNSGGTGVDEMTVVVNIPPVPNAGPDRAITLPENSIQIFGSATDADGTIATYQWTQYAGPTATLSNTSTATLTASNLVAGVYGFRLRVWDDKAAAVNDYVTIVVNIPPVPNAGPDQTIWLPQNNVTLAGSATDQDGVIRTYSWTKVSGGQATLTNASTSTLSVNDLVQGSYTFRLQVTDNQAGAATDDVEVTVLPPTQLPVVNAGADKVITVPLSTTTLTGSATDPDGTIVSYLWTKVSGGTATLTNATTTTVSLSDLVAGTYTFRLTATDNAGASNYDDVNVKVNLLPIPNAGPDMTITLPVTSVQIAGSATDPDGTISSYQWTQYSGAAATLSNTTTSTLTASDLQPGAYGFRFRVWDNNGAAVNDYVTIVVNIPPVANAGTDQTLVLPVNSITLYGSGSDADGVIRTYNWTKVSGGAATLSNTTSANLSVSNLIEGSYTFRLVVADNYYAPSAGDDVTVMVTTTVSGSSVAGSEVEIISQEQLESNTTCSECYVMVYDMQGKLFYSGQYDHENYKAVTEKLRFYCYVLLKNNKKVAGGKVFIVE